MKNTHDIPRTLLSRQEADANSALVDVNAYADDDLVGPYACIILTANSVVNKRPCRALYLRAKLFKLDLRSVCNGAYEFECFSSRSTCWDEVFEAQD